MSEDRYQDYVIKDGQLLGDIESVYEKFEDPWHQSRVDHPLVTRRSIALAQCMHLRGIDPTGQVNRVVKICCGFGHLTDSLMQQGFSAVGTDVSATAVTKAREKNPLSVFMCASIDSPSYLSIWILVLSSWPRLRGTSLISCLAFLNGFASTRKTENGRPI
jgi:SAM-dependent methyltransferase